MEATRKLAPHLNVEFRTIMITVTKQQVAHKLKKQLLKCKTHVLYDTLLANRIDPVPITIYAAESKNDSTEFSGWILFSDEEADICIGYCDDPWGKGWAYFKNFFNETKNGDFSSSWFCQSIKEILDQIIQINAIWDDIESEKKQQQ